VVGTTSGTDIDDLRAACQELCDAVGARRVAVWVHDDRAGAVSPLVAVGADVPAADVARRWSRLPVRELGELADVLQHRTTIRVADAAARDIPAALRTDFGLSSGWFLPLVADDHALGLLVVEPYEVDVAAEGVERIAVALSIARARYRADRRQAELDLLLDLTRTAVEPAATGGAIEHLCQRLALQLGVRRACVFLAEDGVLVAAHAYHADGSVDLDGFRAFTAASSPPPIVEIAFRDRKTLVVDESAPAMLGEWWIERFGVGSGVAIPIGTAEEPKGVLTLDDPRPRRFTERVVSLAETTATHFGLLYERARLLDDHARGLRSGVAVRQLLREGSRAQSPMEAVEIAARVGRQALEAEHACALLLDERATIERVITVAIEEPWRSEVHRRCLGLRADNLPLGQRILAGGQPVVVADVADSDLLPSELLEELPVRSYVAIPLAASGEVRGSLLFTASRHQRRWSRADRHLIEQLMLECELVLENAALREVEAARTEELAWRSLHDQLTGLPNRALLDDRLASALRATSRSGGSVAVLFIDLHRFKDVNDSVGHEAGDRVLAELATRFTASVRPGDTVGRLAGDEFVIVLPQATPDEAAAAADRICNVTLEPLTVVGRTVVVGASVGIALGGHTHSGPELLRLADAAMYRAKRTRGHGYAIAPECLESGEGTHGG
jgi:diguanylate cyclase (GGDEF)-like protein